MEDVGENIDENSEDQQVNDEDNNIKNDCVYLFDEDYPEYEKHTKEKDSEGIENDDNMSTIYEEEEAYINDTLMNDEDENNNEINRIEE